MFFQTSGANLYYEKYGAGKPLILLHGNGESHDIFNKAIPLLAEHFTVYAVDSRGHGKSSAIDELHYADMAQDIHEFICGLKIDPPTVYGFSDGGIIALLLAIHYPNSLSGIIASGVNARPNGIRCAWLTLFKLYYLFTKSPLFKLMLSEPNITADMLSKIKIPVSIIGGSRDMIKTSHMKWIAENVQKGQFTLLKGETHSSYVINTEKLAEIIMDSLLKTINNYSK